MTQQTDLSPVVREVTVPATAARAFEIYVRQYSTWAIKDHHLGPDLPDKVVLEPEVHGRWYEVQPDGSECDWGRVLKLDEPRRIVLSWHIGFDGESWAYDPDPAHASWVEITFDEVAPGQTVVRLCHDGFEAHGTGAAVIHDGVASPDGWALDLAAFQATRP